MSGENEKIRRMGPYEIEELTPTVYAIDDDEHESMYLVIGEERALMIDTGSNAASVADVVRSIYPGPVELVLTHAHFDHMYHCDEFSKVSLHEAEAAAWKKTLGPVVWLSSAGSGKKPKKYPVETYHKLAEGDVIALGGRDLKVMRAEGHTPGSILLVDEKEGFLFTGDAFGSGSYAWMWMPGCLNVSAYKAMLQRVIPALEPYAGYRMLGGHRRQGLPSFDPNAVPLTLQVAKDMEVLCERVLEGKAEVSLVEKNFGVKTCLYRYGQAGIVLRKNKIR